MRRQGRRLLFDTYLLPILLYLYVVRLDVGFVDDGELLVQSKKKIKKENWKKKGSHTHSHQRLVTHTKFYWAY